MLLLQRQDQVLNSQKSCPKNYNSTVLENRIGLFKPVKKCTEFNNYPYLFENKYGYVQTNLILNQQHKDILECIFIAGEKINATANGCETGDLVILFTEYEILKMLYLSKTNYAWLRKKLNEIISTNITIKPNNGGCYTFKIGVKSGYLNTKKKYCFVVSKEYLNFFNSSLKIDYRKYVKNIVSIKEPQVRAIIRYLITFENLNIYLDKLTKYMYGEIKPRLFYNISKSLNDSKDILKKFNITFDSKTKLITKRKTDGIFFKNK